MKTSLHQYFGQLPDPRIQRNKKHLLIDIIVLSIIAVICGAESWDSIEMFGKSKKDFLSKILKLPHGIPSHGTINRVFSLIRADKFEILFIQWAQSLKDPKISKEVISVDGKKLRGFRDSFHEKSAIHTVNAWANSNGLVLGQVKTKEKSTEITAIPELLSILNIEGCIVTIDAMGTQKNIAEKIIEEKADSVDESVEKGHGRLETRKCEVINTLDFLDQKEEWSGLNTLARITAQRKRKGMAANNFALIQKITLNLLRKEESKNMSLKNKRLVAAWDDQFLMKILTI